MLDMVRAWFERCRKLLELGEYEIVFEVVPGFEDLGRCYADPVYPSALVQIRDPSDGSHADWPRSLLHELIHVRMGGGLGTEPGSADRAALERGVEMMTRILYRLITSGASDATIRRAAHGCARSIETARGKAAKRNNMANGKRIVELIAELAAMELPPEAMEKVTELSGLAIGADDMDPGIDPGIDAAKEDPKDAMPPAYAARLARMDALSRKAERSIELRFKAELVATARKALGADCTPAFEKKLMECPPEIAEAMLEGAVSRGAPKTTTTVREGSGGPIANLALLRAGEDAAKLPPLVAQNRAQIARQLGASTAAAALTASSRGPTRTVGRAQRKG